MLLGGGLRSPSAFLVIIVVVIIFVIIVIMNNLEPTNCRCFERAAPRLLGGC